MEGEEDVAGKIIDQWQDLPGSFPHVPNQEWAPVQSSDRANRTCQGMVVSPHVELMYGTPYSPASQPSDVHIFGGSGGGLCLRVCEAQAGWCQKIKEKKSLGGQKVSQ